MTRDLAANLGSAGAVLVAILGLLLNAKVGPMFASAHHGHAAGEEWPAPLPGEADAVFVNARIRQPGYAPASAIAVRHGKILAVGDAEKLMKRRTAATAVHDLHGAYVLPGLRDAHGHLAELGGRIKERVCDLSAPEVNDSQEGVLRTFEAWMKRRQRRPGELLVGSGWDHTRWVRLVPPSPDELKRLQDAGHDFSKDPDQGFKRVQGVLPGSTKPLDQLAPDNPVVLTRVCGHMAWVNRKALALAGVKRDAFNPEGGRILRDRDGEPTGVLVDSAIALVVNRLVQRTEDQQILEAEEDILEGAKACARAGLVEVHDAGVSHVEELALRRLAKAQRLPIRVYAIVSGSKQALSERLARSTVQPGERLTFRAIKLVADGAMGSHGAHLLEPYADDPGSRGLRTLAREELLAAARLCEERGWQLCVHAIGDAANREVLSVCEEVLKGKKDRRWRIEHAQLVAPADFARFAKLGVIASMQPTHATSDMRWAEQRLGEARLAGAYAWRSLLDAKAALAFGSDFPVESERPVLGLYAAVTRQDHAGQPAGGWLPGQRLTAEQALALFTEGPAYASFSEERRGKLLPGMDADFTVFEPDRRVRDAKGGERVEVRDPLVLLAKDPRKILDAVVVGTYVAGENVLE